MGKQQSGVLNLKIADIVNDTSILKVAREIAIETLQKDPSLQFSENAPMSKAYQELNRNGELWSNIS